MVAPGKWLTPEVVFLMVWLCGVIALSVFPEDDIKSDGPSASPSERVYSFGGGPITLYQNRSGRFSIPIRGLLRTSIPGDQANQEQ